MGSVQRDLSFSIDRGGTFTDVFAEIGTESGKKRQRVLKLLSEDPANYKDAPREGIRRVLEEVCGRPHPRDAPLNTSRILSIRMGTTVATNALLERKGEACCLVTTKGFRDLLHIGNQSRPAIFDLEIRVPDVLYSQVVEVDEQVVLPLGEVPDKRAGRNPTQDSEQYPPGGPCTTSVTGEVVCIRRRPDLEAVRRDLKAVLDGGIKSLAVVFKHAAIYPDHEEAVGRVARELGFKQVSLSSEVMQMVKMVPRGFTATADAYLTPHIMRYIEAFQSGFDAGLKDVQLSFMQSDGGLSPVSSFCGHKAVLSGPAGGYVGYALTTQWEGQQAAKLQMIGFDMGGTSTDVSRFAGTYEHVFESTTAGVTIQAPQLDINTVAAGGGSRLFFRTGVFQVGPESAGAHPGPVCYRKGGYAAITDANLVLGRILPEFFPNIFGPNEDQPLDSDAARRALEELARQINEGSPGQPAKSVDEVAMGFVRVANETMCRPIRALTQMKGYDVAQHCLACFGGAGGQHACAIAQNLGMRTIFVQRYAGVLSAVGIGLADVVAEEQEPSAQELSPTTIRELDEQLDALQEKAVQRLLDQGFRDDQIAAERFLNLRYDGTDVAVMTSRSSDSTYTEAFESAYKREFGFILEGRGIRVDDVRVRATGKAVPLPKPGNITSDPGPLPSPARIISAYFEVGGRQDTPAYLLKDLRPGHEIKGPAILIDDISTVVVEPLCCADITAGQDIRIQVGMEADGPKKPLTECDPIQLAIFSHRFMGIAEQMGRVLQRTSISVNIKERLDFSCALFGPDGSLVANAPHLPVHLGAMSEAIRYQIKHWGPGGEGAGEGLQPGDVLASNHPQLAGGSHLPDITVITPVFNGGEIRFFVASRGHHADVGGITPGSMPPNSHSLAEEGAAILSFKLVRSGVFQGEGITDILMAPGKLSNSIPGISGTRNLSDNLSDLKAQVAANNKGISLVGDLIEEYGLPTVIAYMHHIQANAEDAVRQMLVAFSEEQQLPEVGTVIAEDQMDDGTPIRLSVTVDRRDGSAVFNFEGTGPQVFGNTNAPPAVTYSAIIYSLRCMVHQDIPLNQGCLKPITVRIPPGSILSPSPTAAVVGGNVLTSQRVTDVVLKAFNAAAASQGCMNNLTFGDEGMGYYETIAGGAGAGPGWAGRSGVHTHMTNTRITDPEILERRYPVVLHCFSLRLGSGGPGRWRGGDGVVREIEFLRPMTACILSERRAVRPFGILGGGPALAGLNLLLTADGRTVNLGGKNNVQLRAGERLRILTPGGGGCGSADDRGEQVAVKKQRMDYSAIARVGGSVAKYKADQESA
ncbi:g2900 [Coccomyxa elongata]